MRTARRRIAFGAGGENGLNRLRSASTRVGPVNTLGTKRWTRGTVKVSDETAEKLMKRGVIVDPFGVSASLSDRSRDAQRRLA